MNITENQEMGLFYAKRMTDGEPVVGCLIHIPDENNPYYYIATINDMQHTLYVDELENGHATMKLTRVIEHTIKPVSELEPAVIAQINPMLLFKKIKEKPPCSIN